MKKITLEDLEKIKDRNFQKVNQGKDRQDIRIVVGMGTCGIAAGAVQVYETFEAEIENQGLKDITLVKTGCIGVCRLEPIVEIIKPGEEKVTYVKVTPNKVRNIIEQHIINGKVVEEFTIHIIENRILNDFTRIDG
ncbi:(2Fe-2S) ferredoxin [Clostridium pascui]|uniref:(2Fe-2S) ferredoxin domain-containing protein n=1 Tax=Clostridium pascui TaxID=46609 RepID=UPI00195C20C7|nr:(2Fe-2S) ferredoxin domain-containing protein [Clostridium pascui]MBM7870987.1 (2Fe-2S) ferredoxin [Clostridium pascui]